MVGSATPHDIINVGNYMGMSSVFNINNNMLLYPDWTDEYTMAPGTKKPRIMAGDYGMVYAANNVIEGYDNWLAGNSKDEETGDYTWLEADTANNYTMATAELAWDDFYDRANKDFSLLKEYKVYNARQRHRGKSYLHRRRSLVSRCFPHQSGCKCYCKRFYHRYAENRARESYLFCG